MSGLTAWIWEAGPALLTLAVFEAGLTPAWQPTHATQYGLLKTWQVTSAGAQVDGLKVSDVTLADLNILNQPYISVRIGVKPDARHVGGVNLFGAKFGNYPQDILLRLRYH